ncbi:IgA peptidase M64-domain-containing protein [Daedaleopsis nitida]|nr:IgA peptidase M64-domain-containing protein [Daedaleopsis nitida]
MLVIVLVALCFHYTSALTQLDWHVSRPYELIVHRDTDSTHQCTHLALRQTQLFRALPDGGYLKSKVLKSGEERTQFIAWEEDRVWTLAESLCGKRDTWSNFQPLIQSDVRLAATSEAESEQSILRPCSDNALPLKVEPLITSGDSGNRVDLMFFADGYTAEEESKFYEDALRLAQGITASNQSFHTVKPLLNFWAAFTPSKESGVGVGGVPKDTAFGLYRDGTELRGVYYSKPEVAREACFSLGDRCNFPILMGNDPLYGGMDSEFTTITPSLANGPLVLRHELGHNIIDIGEEYDGGSADIYHGVNSAQNISLDTLPWAHWLTDTFRGSQGHSHPHDHGSSPRVPRVERAVMPLQDYAWTMLNTSTAWSTTFYSSGTYARHLVRFSLSGLPLAEDLTVELDGRDLHWEPHADIGVDRWHYDIEINQTLAGSPRRTKRRTARRTRVA